nr:hypothetical protein [Francisella tularensis]
MNYHIKEVFWSIILSFLKSQKGIHTNDEAKLRLFIEAVFLCVTYRLSMENVTILLW